MSLPFPTRTAHPMQALGHSLWLHHLCILGALQPPSRAWGVSVRLMDVVSAEPRNKHERAPYSWAPPGQGTQNSTWIWNNNWDVGRCTCKNKDTKDKCGCRRWLMLREERHKSGMQTWFWCLVQRWLLLRLWPSHFTALLPKCKMKKKVTAFSYRETIRKNGTIIMRLNTTEFGSM